MIFKGKRSRASYGLVVVTVVIVSFLLRVFHSLLPDFMDLYFNTVLWGYLVFLIIGILYPLKGTRTVAFFSFCVAAILECLQLYQPKAVIILKETTIGGLVYGHGFLPTDFICIAIGTLIGILFEVWMKKTKQLL